MLYDLRSPFTWLLYALALVIYSSVAFKFSWNGNKSPIFSARNVKPRRDIFLVHVVFLGVMFNILLLMARFFPDPNDGSFSWLNFRFGRTFTVLDCVLIAIGYVVSLVEQRFIYVDAKTGKTDLPDDLDYY
jgi:hypothetical protein